MKSNLAIVVDGKPLTLPSDFSIDIDLQNPMFNESEMYSYPVNIPIEGNRHLLKNIEDVASDVRSVDFEHLPAAVVVSGVPLCHGTLVMQDEEEVTDGVSMSISAADQSFADLIGNLRCNEIPVKDKIVIGEKLGNVHVTATVDGQVTVIYERGSKSKDTKKTYGTVSGKTIENTFEPQALGFSYPGECYVLDPNTQIAVGLEPFEGHQAVDREYDGKNKVRRPPVKTSYINVAAAYGELDNAGRPATYCNARVCYKHYALDDDGSTSDKNETEIRLEELENRGAYWVLDADRPQSGICFYVLYFLDCLFSYLGVEFDKSALLEIEDFKHLCFYTTKCSYDVEVLHAKEYYTAADEKVISGEKKVGDVKVPFFEGVSEDGTHLDERLFGDMNEWLSSRGAGGQLSIAPMVDKSVSDITFTPYKWMGFGNIVYGEPTKIVVGVDCESITISNSITKATASANIMQMVANGDNFPAESVSSLLESLENAFGIKFHYDYDKKKVTAYLLREMFRGNHTTRNLLADVFQINKVSEKITGVRMCYSNESDSKEQADNLRYGVKDYDTDYDYIQYPDPETAKMGETSTVYEKTYREFFTDLSNNDMNVYVDRTTGNAYRVKIDSAYTDSNSMKPVLFEVGQWKGVEFGDCSPINEDYVQEFSIGFTPITFNDVNYKLEASGLDKYKTEDVSPEEVGEGFDGAEIDKINSSVQPLLAAYMDEDMEHEFVEQRIDTALSSSTCDVIVRAKLKLVESYDPTSTDDGNSPLQTYDWGTAIAIMRGGGSNMTTQRYDFNFDGFGNSRWRSIVGQYALCSDTMDAFGNIFDYNGDAPGLGGINGTWDGTYTVEEAASAIKEMLPESNADLTASARSEITMEAAAAKGWTVSSSADLPYITGSINFLDYDGIVKRLLFVAVKDDGTILTPAEISAYFSTAQGYINTRNVPISEYDKKNLCIVVGSWAVSIDIQSPTGPADAANYYGEVLKQMGAIVFGDAASGSVSVAIPSTIWVPHNSKSMESFSLKINADKTELVDWAMERGISLCNADEMDDFGRIKTKIRSRGLWQSFMIDFGYFLLHRKRYIVRCRMEMAQLADIPNHWKEWWNIAGKRCLINKVSCKATIDGLEDVELEVFSL